MREKGEEERMEGEGWETKWREMGEERMKEKGEKKEWRKRGGDK